MSFTESTQTESQPAPAPRPQLVDRVRAFMKGRWLATVVVALLGVIALSGLFHLHQIRVDDETNRRANCLTAVYDYNADKGDYVRQTYQQMDQYSRALADFYDCKVAGR